MESPIFPDHFRPKLFGTLPPLRPATSMLFRASRRPLRVAPIRLLALLAALCLSFPAAARSQSGAEPQPGFQPQPKAQPQPQSGAQPQSGPQPVTMGMYVVDLNEFDLKSGSYTADFYLWVRWDGPREGGNFEVMNGSGEPCVPALRREVGTMRYAVFRCRYQLHRSFDMADYPLDGHELTIEVEDREFTQEELVYVPDQENTALDEAISLPGWKLGAPRMRVGTHAYTALGDPTRPRGSATPYSRLVLAIPMERDGGAIYLKSFLVLFLSVGVGLLCSALECGHVEARLGLGVASIFGVVSSYMVVSQVLPETAQFTLADQLHLVGMGIVFVSILVSVSVYRMCGRIGEARAERIDRVLGWASTVGFVAAVLAVTFVR